MTPPTELDWVKARHECTLASVFSQLQYQIGKDIETRDAQIPANKKQGEHRGFLLKPLGKDAFEVHRNGAGIFSKIGFRQTDKQIVVQDESSKTILAARIGLNDEDAAYSWWTDLN